MACFLICRPQYHNDNIQETFHSTACVHISNHQAVRVQSEQPAAFLWYVWIFLIYISINTDVQKSVIIVDWTWKNRLPTKKKKMHLFEGSSVVVMMDGHVLHLLMMRMIKRSYSKQLHLWVFEKFKFVSEWIQLACCSFPYPPSRSSSSHSL